MLKSTRCCHAVVAVAAAAADDCLNPEVLRDIASIAADLK